MAAAAPATSNMLFDFRKEQSCLVTAFSKIFDRKGRFEIDRSFGSRLINAILND